jgi:hypothetical protein
MTCNAVPHIELQTYQENSMQLRPMSALLASCILMLCSAGFVHAQAADPAVKKSESGICHDKTSSSYGVTKKFESFPNMEACLKSGGRAPANAAAAEAVVKKSESGICHDKSSASYEKTQKFTPFKTIDECVKSGGTLPKK